MRLILPAPSAQSGGNSRGHWSRVHRERAAEKELAWGAALEDGWGGLMLSPVNITIHWYGWNKPDRDNILSRCKAYLDGLVLAGVIPDDGPDHVASITVGTVWIDRDYPHIEIEIEEAE